MIHDKIQNCSIDKTRIMMIEKSRQKGRTPKEVFFPVKSPTPETWKVFFLKDKEYFLSGPILIIRFPCNRLANCCLVDLIDVTQVCEDANSTLLYAICHNCHLCKIFLGSGKIFKN